ncbi:hypothetical protein IQ268_22040 [Oculatella sp. LEGE 06141]|uniref:DUF5331 domain-containing protein n=1 Tax=Oculatella sp. LEGE 06141 TaxID=1828648 RepID=UPI00187FCA3C|nr:hypothetical protein [Oculatella sp. LEGE 06141]
MNTQQLRLALKTVWLDYYREHRPWLTRLGVWVTCDGQRRPSSSFILATLAILEPELTQLLPLIVDLSSNPDRIVMALGLNFNPDKALEGVTETEGELAGESVKMLPSSPSAVDVAIARTPIRRVSMVDESCEGVRGEDSTDTTRKR